MYTIHGFRLMIDQGLLSALAEYMITNKIKTREGAVNSIFETMEAYIDMIVAGGHDEEMQDLSTDYLSDGKGLVKSVVINIRDYNFDKLQFLHFRFKTFSIATILRRLLRLFLILKREKILGLIEEFEEIFRGLLGWGNKFKVHMSEFEPKTTTKIYLDYKYRLKKLIVHKKNLYNR